MNGYAPSPKLAAAGQTFTSADIDRVFKREAGWFERDRVRKRLYAKGFPHPIDRGTWSAAAVFAWLQTAGNNPHNEPPPSKHRGTKRARRARRPAAASGYAPA